MIMVKKYQHNKLMKMYKSNLHFWLIQLQNKMHS